MMKLLFLAFWVWPFFAEAQSVQPGIWRADSSFEVSGIPLPASHEEECINATDAKDIKKSILKELAHQGCNSTKWIVKGQKIEVALKCVTAGLDATGVLRGTVSAKSYDLSGEAEGSYHDIPAQASLKLSGKWIKSCGK